MEVPLDAYTICCAAFIGRLAGRTSRYLICGALESGWPPWEVFDTIVTVEIRTDAFKDLQGCL